MSYIHSESDNTSRFLELNFNALRKKTCYIARRHGYSDGEGEGFLSFVSEELIKQKQIEKYDPTRGNFDNFVNYKLGQLFVDFQRRRNEWTSDRWYAFNSSPLSKRYMTIGPRVERIVCRNKIPRGEAWKYLSTPQIQLGRDTKTVELTDSHGFKTQMHRFQHKKEVYSETGEEESQEIQVFVKEFEVEGEIEQFTWIKNRFFQFVKRIEIDFASRHAALFVMPPPDDWDREEKDSFPFQAQAGLNKDLNETELNEQLEDVESFIKRAVDELKYKETDILAFRMVCLLDYKISEVARSLHINRTTLDYRLQNMTKKLREIYGNYGRPRRR